MNSTEFFNMTPNLDNFNGDCIHQYLTFVFGGLFVISELMGLYQKSNCNEIQDVESEEVSRPRKESLIQKSNGILHILYVLFNKKK